MNIKKLNETLESLVKFTEDVQEENELAEKKRQKRIYQAAVIAMEELMDLLKEGTDPATGKLDDETEDFYNRLKDLVHEIDSRSLVFV